MRCAAAPIQAAGEASSRTLVRQQSQIRAIGCGQSSIAPAWLDSGQDPVRPISPGSGQTVEEGYRAQLPNSGCLSPGEDHAAVLLLFQQDLRSNRRKDRWVQD